MKHYTQRYFFASPTYRVVPLVKLPDCRAKLGVSKIVARTNFLRSEVEDSLYRLMPAQREKIHETR